jgi:hypothetical protein
MELSGRQDGGSAAACSLGPISHYASGRRRDSRPPTVLTICTYDS